MTGLIVLAWVGAGCGGTSKVKKKDGGADGSAAADARPGSDAAAGSGGAGGAGGAGGSAGDAGRSDAAGGAGGTDAPRPPADAAADTPVASDVPQGTDTRPDAPADQAVADAPGMDAPVDMMVGTMDMSMSTASLSISDVMVTEGNSGATMATFTVTLSSAATAPVTVGYATVDDTAKSSGLAASGGSDYVVASGTLTFAAGTTTQTVTVTVNGDALNEADETFFVDLSNPTNATIGDARGQGTITNDDAVPTLTIADDTVAEPSATGTLGFKVTLSAASGRDVTVMYATADGTATAGADYTATMGTLTFAAGETTKTITVTVLGDTLDEADEKLTVALSMPVNATLADGMADGTITDDDPAPTISTADVSIGEGDTGTTMATVTVTLSAASGQQVTVKYATADGTGMAPSDYTSATGTVTFAPGETSKTISLSVVGDPNGEPDETFFVNLTEPMNATIAVAQAKVTILNDDASGPRIDIGDAMVTEGNTGTKMLSFTVTLTATSTDTVTVVYATADGTATVGGAAAAGGGDYVTAGGTVSFAPGETSKMVSVVINGDAVFEADETFSVNLAGAVNGHIGDGQGVGTITNDDTAPAISIGDVSVAEGAAGTRAATFTVTLSEAAGVTSSATYATAAGTATAGIDYLSAMGTVSFMPGQTSTTVTVLINGDLMNEPDETFLVNLTNPMNATLGDGQAQGTIRNDDPVPTISIADTAVIEGDSGTSTATFTVTLSAPSGQTVTVSYATADGTATAGGDYTAATGTVTFMSGETSQTIKVQVTPDTMNEANETFVVNLTNPMGATLAIDKATGTIVNDDSLLPGISINNGSVTEGNTGTRVVTFSVTLSRPDIAAVSVNFATANGTAAAGTDYVAATGTVTFAPGDTSKTIDVTVNGDTVNEADETFVVNLSGEMNATLIDGQGQGTIINDDPAPSLSVADASTAEGNTGTKTVTFTVTLSAVSGQTVTVAYATADDTATAGGNAGEGGKDYDSTSGTLTFAPGDTTKDVTVTINGDALNEADETFALTLSAPQNSVISDGDAVGTISNDDAVPTLSISDVTASEGNAGLTSFNFTVTLSASSGRQVTVSYTTADDTATSPSDFVATTGTVTFARGETMKTITVNVKGDTSTEANEAFKVTLSNPMNATIADGDGVGTINNDD